MLTETDLAQGEHHDDDWLVSVYRDPIERTYHLLARPGAPQHAIDKGLQQVMELANLRTNSYWNGDFFVREDGTEEWIFLA